MNQPRRCRPEELQQARWRKSLFSGGANDCVQIAELGSCVAARDSKDLGEPPLIFSCVALLDLMGQYVACGRALAGPRCQRVAHRGREERRGGSR
ncbi:DUF397 domain-containing protein [Streptomyces sp. NPDC091281]|uniref:DUF397 domain-containing protein n=1 Tax=Streptomyces sp. NPDC091281 TaxID=3365985 RepID=UPI00380152A4